MQSFRDLIINIGGGCNRKPCSLWTLIEGQDEPIKKENMSYTLVKPVKPGFRRLLTITPDEEVDKMADGSFAKGEVLQGAPTQFTIDPSSTAKVIKAYAYGDGALGDKVARVSVDGHLNEGEVLVSLDIMWAVASPDATTLSVTEGPDEAIPPVVPA